MSNNNSGFKDDPAQSCTADEQCIRDAELNGNPTICLSGHTDEVNMNTTDHGPQVNDEERSDVSNGDSKVRTHEAREYNMQTMSKPGTSSSRPKKNGLVRGSGKRSNGQANKLAKAVNQPASRPSPLTSLQTPQIPLVSSLFPASFASPAIFTPPSNENGHRQMNYSNQLLHKIQRQVPALTHVSAHTALTHVSAHMGCATDSSQENQQTASNVSAKSHKDAKRRKPAVDSHDRAAAMETLTESSTLPPHFYYPTGHMLFPQLDSCTVQNLHGYSNYAAFTQRPNDYSWMIHQNAAFHSSNITNMKSVLERANIANRKALSDPTQQKPQSDSSYGKQKHEKSTHRDHKEHEKPTQENEEIKCTPAIKSEPCFPVTKINTGSPAGSPSLHSPHLNSSNEFMFGKSRIPSPRRSFNDKYEHDASDSDLSGIAPKKKRRSGGENASVSWTTSPHSSIAHHTFHPPVTSSPHSHKPTSESAVPVLSLPSPLTPRSIQVVPSSSETALTLEQALENQQYPFGPLQPNVTAMGQVVAREKDVFYCHMCSYYDKSKTEFDAHMNTHFEFNCPHCDYTARTEGRLKRHIKDFHSENSFKRHLSDRSKTFKCKQCTFTSTEREKYWEHNRTHIKENKLLQCPHCSFVTEHKHHLEYHVSNHFGSKPFKCDKCNYSCVNKSMLNSHKKSHTKIYPYRCSDCTYATKYSHSLKLHLKKYKHQPAMALNQDGSLPEKADADNIGLGSKSQYSTDQSDLRSDAINPYFSQFGVPSAPVGMPVMTPALSNMMSFWPMVHPTSMQSSMLTGALMFNQLAGDGGVIKVDSKMEGESKHATKHEKGEINSRMDINKFFCQKCSLTFTSTEAWYHHIYYMHGDTAKEAAEYSYSNDKVPRQKHNRSSCNQDRKNHQLLDPLIAPDDQQDKVPQNNSSSWVLPTVNSDHVNNKRAQKAESANSLPESSPLPLYPDKSSCKHKLEYVHQNVTVSNNKNEIISDPINRADTVQHVTKNCEPEIFCQKKILPGEQTLQEDERNTQNTVRNFKNNFHLQCSPNALEIPQQKPSTVFSHLDFPMKKDKENIKSNKDHSINEVKSPSKASTLLPSKHILSEGENIVINSRISTDEIIIPRKRSRKGKAYKLDIAFLQQQKIQTDSSCDEAELEFVTGIAFDQDRPLKFTDKDKTYDETVTDVQRCKPKVISDQQTVTGESNVGLYDAKSKYLLARNTEKMAHENYKKRNTEFSQNKNTNKEDIEIKEKNKTKSDIETIENSENGQLIFHEAELELQKMQSEQIESYSKKLETYQTDTELVNVSENTNGKLCVGSHAKENATEVSASNRMVSENIAMTAHSVKIIDQLSQAEMRNSVTEETEKTVCSPIKRSTDLVRRIMKEGVIPMSSELSPVRSSSQKQTGMSSPVLQSSLPDLSVRVNNPLPIHNDIKSSDVLPYFSYPHYFNSSQPSNPHALNSALLAKPPANLVFSTPKAYVHPTNRKTPDPTVAPPTSEYKQCERKLYECTHCELSFGDCVMYTVHMGYHSKRNAFQCNNCGVVCQDRVEFFLHMVRSSHV